MYAHQAIENLEIQIKNNMLKGNYLRVAKSSVKAIKKSTRIHLPRASKALSLFKVGEERVCGFLKEYIKLPYDSCWLEYYQDREIMSGAEPARKRAFLCTRYTKNIFNAALFCQAEKIKNLKGLWYFSPISYFVAEGRAFNKIALSERVDLEQYIPGIMDILNKYEKQRSFRYILPLPFENIKTKTSIKIIKEDMEDLAHLNLCLVLMNAKNAEIEEIKEPTRLNKKRERNGRMPILSYKLLKIMVPGATREIGEKAGAAKYINRIHFCRGHFKIYTKENPLFGKHAGLYWWQPHLRGKNKKGMVLKDYEVCPKVS